MKRTALILGLFFTSACQSTIRPADNPPPTISAAIPAPVFVSALCTLMGQPVRTEVPAGRPVILMWGWSAETLQQIRDYLAAADVVVTFDGVEREGRQQGGTPYDESADVYRIVFAAEVGIPDPGGHTITYSLTFRTKIFDGTAYYGPGSKNEKQEDRCEILVHQDRRIGSPWPTSRIRTSGRSGKRISIPSTASFTAPFLLGISTPATVSESEPSASSRH